MLLISVMNSSEILIENHILNLYTIALTNTGHPFRVDDAVGS